MCCRSSSYAFGVYIYIPPSANIIIFSNNEGAKCDSVLRLKVELTGLTPTNAFQHPFRCSFALSLSLSVSECVCVTMWLLRMKWVCLHALSYLYAIYVRFKHLPHAPFKWTQCSMLCSLSISLSLCCKLKTTKSLSSIAGRKIHKTPQCFYFIFFYLNRQKLPYDEHIRSHSCYIVSIRTRVQCVNDSGYNYFIRAYNSKLVVCISLLRPLSASHSVSQSVNREIVVFLSGRMYHWRAQYNRKHTRS